LVEIDAVELMSINSALPLLTQKRPKVGQVWGLKMAVSGSAGFRRNAKRL
jgi:hypothetical protein